MDVFNPVSRRHCNRLLANAFEAKIGNAMGQALQLGIVMGVLQVMDDGLALLLLHWQRLRLLLRMMRLHQWRLLRLRPLLLMALQRIENALGGWCVEWRGCPVVVLHFGRGEERETGVA